MIPWHLICAYQFCSPIRLQQKGLQFNIWEFEFHISSWIANYKWTDSRLQLPIFHQISTSFSSMTTTLGIMLALCSLGFSTGIVMLRHWARCKLEGQRSLLTHGLTTKAELHCVTSTRGHCPSSTEQLSIGNTGAWVAAHAQTSLALRCCWLS